MNRIQNQVFKYDPPSAITNHFNATRKRNLAESSCMQTVSAIQDQSAFRTEKLNESTLTYKLLGASLMNLDQPSETLIVNKQSLI